MRRLLPAVLVLFGLLGCPSLRDAWADCAVWVGEFSTDTLRDFNMYDGLIESGNSMCHDGVGEQKNQNVCFRISVSSKSGQNFSIEFERVEP